MTDETVKVAVCGAHMSGLPLNHQLTGMGGKLVVKTTTAPCYRFYKLPDFIPPRPGLVRVMENGCLIEVEVWELPINEYGKLVANIPSPLGIGTLELLDHPPVQGFLCEAFIVPQSTDISNFGGWRQYISSVT